MLLLSASCSETSVDRNGAALKDGLTDELPVSSDGTVNPLGVFRVETDAGYVEGEEGTFSGSITLKTSSLSSEEFARDSRFTVLGQPQSVQVQKGAGIAEASDFLKPVIVKLKLPEGLSTTNVRVLMVTGYGTGEEMYFAYAREDVTFVVEADGRTYAKFTSYQPDAIYMLVEDSADVDTLPIAKPDKANFPLPDDAETLTVSSTTSQSISLQWSAGSGPRHAFQLVYSSGATAPETCSTGTKVDPIPATETRTTIEGLSPLSTYSFRLCGANASYPPDYAEGLVVTGTTSGSALASADSTAPSPGGGGALAVDTVQSDSISVSWSAASDLVSPQSNLKYLAFTSTTNNIDTPAKAMANGTPAGIFKAGITSKTITGLNSEQTYYVTVLVRDLAGNAAAYTMTSATTLGPQFLALAETFSIAADNSLLGYPLMFTEYQGRLQVAPYEGMGTFDDNGRFVYSNEVPIIPGERGLGVVASSYFKASFGLMFTAATASNYQYGIFVTDGTAHGQTLLSDAVHMYGGYNDYTNPRLTMYHAIEMGGVVIFSGVGDDDGSELFKTDGTPSGTVLVKDIRSGATGSNIYGPFFDLGGKFVFSADDGTNGRELWVSDGTAAGTNLLVDIVSGASGSGAQYFVEMGGIVYFEANDGGGLDLWRTDGTSGGTYVVRSSGGPGQLRHMIAHNNKLYLESGADIWTSDGTYGGTVTIPSANGLYPNWLYGCGGYLYFENDSTANASVRFELYQINLSNLETDIAFSGPGSTGADPQPLSCMDGEFLFGSGDAIYKTDGTTVSKLADYRYETMLSYLEEVREATTSETGEVYFFGNDLLHGNELMVTDGTPEGTKLVFNSNREWNFNEPLIVGENLYFYLGNEIGAGIWKINAETNSAQLIFPVGSYDTVSLGPRYGDGILILADAGNDYELWYSNGELGGNFLMASGYVQDVQVVGTTILFEADHATAGYELHKITSLNGSATLVKDNCSTCDLAISGSTIVGGKYFARGRVDASTYGLFVSDGTSAGTTTITGPTGVYSLYDWNGVAYFRGYDGTSYHLWKSDGTQGGTAVVSTDAIYPYQFIGLDTKLVFVASDSGANYEIWATDGTGGGTGQLKDIKPGTDSSSPTDLVLFDGWIYFTADDGVTGRELWRTDGTVANTTLVADLYPGATGSEPDHLKVMDGSLYFAARHETRGVELWKLSSSTAQPILEQEFFAGQDGSYPIPLGESTTRIFIGANTDKPKILMREKP